MGEQGADEAVAEYGAEPTVLLLTDDPDAAVRWERAATSARIRILDTVGLADAVARLDRQVAVDAVVAEFAEDAAGGEMHPLLARLEAGVAAGDWGAIVSAPPAHIDLVAARGLMSEVHHLVEPSEGERIHALAEAAGRPPARLHDVNKARATVRLQQLSEEVGRIAAVLATLSEDETTAVAVAGLDADEGDAEKIDAGQVRAIIRGRRLRANFFKSDLFADPAWDMMLDLMAARLEERRVAVSSLCIAAAVPPTTALRWIKMLCDYGLFLRIADPEDGRRVFIQLSDSAAASLEAFLKAVRRISPLVL